MSTEGVPAKRRRPRFLRPGWIFLYTLLALFAAAAIVDNIVNAPGEPLAPEASLPASAAELESLLLRREVAVAETETFYLVLDPAAPSLSLKYQGTLLLDFPLQKVEFGLRKGLLRRPRPPADWVLRTWAEAEMDPPRHAERIVEVAPALGDTAPPPVVPPTPEEAFPAPPRWRLRYAGGLSVEFVGVDSTGAAAQGEGLDDKLRHQMEDLRTALDGNTAPRIRVTVSNEVLGRLYRGLPVPSALLLLPPRRP